MSSSKASSLPKSDVDSGQTPISTYLRSREGKRWRSADTKAILARAAELDRIMERLLMLSGVPVSGSTVHVS